MGSEAKEVLGGLAAGDAAYNLTDIPTDDWTTAALTQFGLFVDRV